MTPIESAALRFIVAWEAQDDIAIFEDDSGSTDLATERLIDKEVDESREHLKRLLGVGDLAGVGDVAPHGGEGSVRIWLERKRQVQVEGYDAEHDRGQRWAITRAGIAYAIASLSTLTDDQHDEAWAWWPWSTEAWKPKDALADLVRAGALIAAAIDAMLASEPAKDAAIARMVDDEYEARFETASDGGEL